MRFNNNDITRSLNEAINNVVSGSSQEPVNVHEEAGRTGGPGGDTRQQYAGQQDAIQLIMQSMMDDDFDYEAFFQTPEGQDMLDLYDYNGDGTIDFTDLQILLSMESAGLPFMDADDYIKYMESDSRSGRKQRQGSQLQIGTKFGSKTSRPPRRRDNMGLLDRIPRSSGHGGGGTPILPPMPGHPGGHLPPMPGGPF